MPPWFLLSVSVTFLLDVGGLSVGRSAFDFMVRFTVLAIVGRSSFRRFAVRPFAVLSIIRPSRHIRSTSGSAIQLSQFGKSDVGSAIPVSRFHSAVVSEFARSAALLVTGIGRRGAILMFEIDRRCRFAAVPMLEIGRGSRSVAVLMFEFGVALSRVGAPSDHLGFGPTRLPSRLRVFNKPVFGLGTAWRRGVGGINCAPCRKRMLPHSTSPRSFTPF